MSVQNTDFPLFLLCKLFFTSFMLRAGYIQAAELCSFSEKALRDYTLTPQPPPSLQDPRPRSIGTRSRIYTCIYRIAGFFPGRKLSRISLLWRFAKVFSAKIYFKAIRYRASGRGALGYCKFAKVFSEKMYFQVICESFLPRKKPAIRYICAVLRSIN